MSSNWNSNIHQQIFKYSPYVIYGLRPLFLTSLTFMQMISTNTDTNNNMDVQCTRKIIVIDWVCFCVLTRIVHIFIHSNALPELYLYYFNLECICWILWILDTSYSILNSRNINQPSGKVSGNSEGKHCRVSIQKTIDMVLTAMMQLFQFHLDSFRMTNDFWFSVVVIAIATTVNEMYATGGHN